MIEVTDLPNDVEMTSEDFIHQTLLPHLEIFEQMSTPEERLRYMLIDPKDFYD